MCGRYIIVSKLKKIEKRFNASVKSGDVKLESNFNIAPGDLAPVITSESPNNIEFFRFGLQPFWAKKPMYLINARAEGDHNKENDFHYKGSFGITNKPSFRKAFRSQRCIIPADAFIEGTTKEKLNKPFVVYPINKEDRPFAFAGLYDRWTDTQTGEIISSFSIITTVSTPLLRMIPHHRSPVCLDGPEEESLWLNNSSVISDLEDLLRYKEDHRFNAYPIAPEIKNPRLKHADLIKPVGERLVKEFDYEIHRDLELFGMGSTSARRRKQDEV
jgi:putative SOS response-associated peptidase YedK